MTPLDLFKTRAAIVGLPLALTLGAVSGAAMQIGPQDAQPQAYAEAAGSQYAEAAPATWPAGAVPDYVIGSDFLARPQDQAPVVLASAELEDIDLVEPASDAPDQDLVSASGATAPLDQPENPPEPADAPPARGYASTAGDILDVRLPEEVVAGPPRPTAVAVAGF